MIAVLLVLTTLVGCIAALAHVFLPDRPKRNANS
jgi:hypothetical protein